LLHFSFFVTFFFQRHPIGDRSLSAVNSFLDAIAFKATHYISQLCEEHLRLTRQVSEKVNFFYSQEFTSSKISVIFFFLLFIMLLFTLFKVLKKCCC